MLLCEEESRAKEAVVILVKDLMMLDNSEDDDHCLPALEAVPHRDNRWQHDQLPQVINSHYNEGRDTWV